MSRRAVVLLSAGLDSTVNMYAARAAGWDVVLALTARYGQRAADREVAAAKSLCADLGVPHKVVDLPFVRDFQGSALIDERVEIPVGAAVAVDDLKVSGATAQAVWVPNRNGILLNVGAGFAEAMGAEAVVPGFNAEEARTFPDNSGEFLEALSESLKYSTAKRVRAVCFTTDFDKPAMARKARDLGVPVDKLWLCYFGGATWCGSCESCQRNRRALVAAGFAVTELFGE